MASLLLLLFFAVAGLQGCASSEEGAMPITTKSKKARAYYIEGRDLAERLRGIEAHDYFEKALAEDSLFALAYLSISFVEPNARKFFEQFERAKSLIDSVSKGEQLLIQATDAAIKGNQSEQERSLTALISLHPNDARPHNLLGGLYFGQQRYALAIKSFDASIAIDPNYSSSYNLLGYCYRFIGNLEKAAEIFKKYTNLIPDDPNPHDSYAELLLKKGEFELSIESYRRALSLDAGFVASYLGIASNLCYQGRHQEARDELNQLYAVARNDGQRRQALYGIAASFVDEGLIDSARASILKAKHIAERVDDVRAAAADYNTLGVLELEQMNATAAGAYFDSSVSLTDFADLDEVTKERTRRFHMFLHARLAILDGDLLKADSLSSEFEKSVGTLSSIPQTALSHELKAILALASKDYESVLEELAQANPRSPYNIYRKALAYHAKGELQRAIDELNNVVHFNPVLGIDFAFVRGKAQTLLDSLTAGL